MRIAILAWMIAAPVAAFALEPAPPPPSPFQEMIRRQLESVANERPPAPVPGVEAEALRDLQPLPQPGSSAGAAPARSNRRNP